MAGPNAQPLRGHRKDGMIVHLEATNTGTAWVVDTAETDNEFWTTTVTDTGVGDNAFNFRLSYGARRATVVGWNLVTTATPLAADGWHVLVTKPILSTGVMQVRTCNANATPALADAPAGARLSVTLSVETL